MAGQKNPWGRSKLIIFRLNLGYKLQILNTCKYKYNFFLVKWARGNLKIWYMHLLYVRLIFNRKMSHLGTVILRRRDISSWQFSIKETRHQAFVFSENIIIVGSAQATKKISWQGVAKCAFMVAFYSSCIVAFCSNCHCMKLLRSSVSEIRLFMDGGPLATIGGSDDESHQSFME